MLARTTRGALLAALVLAGAGVAMADYGDALDTGGSELARNYVRHAIHAMEQGRVSEAIDYSNRALNLYPSFVFARFTRGRAELQECDTAAAIADFDKVIAAHPEYPAVYAMRAQAYLYAHDAPRAIDDYNRAARAPVGAGSWGAASIVAARSVAYEMIGQNDFAITDLKRAMSEIAITDHDYAMLNYRCYIAAVVGLLETAAESCDESIARHSRDVGVYDSRGLLELKQHDWSHAIADYTRALYYRPNLTYSLYGRGLARQASGDAAGARTDMQAALAGEPRIAAIMARLGVSPRP